MNTDSNRNYVAETTRFDDSFATHMIRDFFLVLVTVVIFELSIRFGLVIYDFHENQQMATQIAAERLASDIKSIMLNSGGPVAARTVYPILERTHEDLGLAIAIEPSEVTVSSIESAFSFTPRGLPAEWSEGEHHEVRVDVVAEQFCISCHVTAKPGDVLGSITIRSYLSSHLSQWWHEVRVASLLGRSMIAQLAKGASDLSHRARIKSRDEFGELARDLNSFLDRIDHVMEDLSDVLATVLVVNRRLTQVHDQMGDHFRRIDANVMAASENALLGQNVDPLLSREWLNSTRMLASVLKSMTREGRIHHDMDRHIDRFCETLEEMVTRVEHLSRRHEGLVTSLKEVSGELYEFRHFLEEMAVLEEKMRGITDQGQTLLQRLRNVEAIDDDDDVGIVEATR
jgi:HAMP domain-containing protein